MGIKQKFLSQNLDSVESKQLKNLWDALPAECSKVVVVDGTNFLFGFMDLHQLRLQSAAIPRFQEIHDALSSFLRAFYSACPGVELHFIFDGVSCDKALESKGVEAIKRAKDRIIQSAEEAVKYFERGSCRQGPLSSHVLRWCLDRVLRTIPGRHWMGRAHAATQDLDMACVLHANLHKSGMILSSDSDFLAMFSGVVIPLKNLLFTEHGLSCKALHLEDRFRALCINSFEELRVAAFLAGSDFTRPILEAPWKEIAERARELVASETSWRNVIRAVAADPDDAEAFLANFDVDAYVPTKSDAEEGCGPESWQCDGVVAFGITSMSISHLPIVDPVLLSFLPSHSGEGRLNTIYRRCLRAYSQGMLSGEFLRLVRHKTFQESVGLVDFARFLSGSSDRPVAMFKRQQIGRIASFLAGPPPDSWEDDDHEPSYLATEIEIIRKDVLQHCVPYAQFVVDARNKMKDGSEFQIEKMKLEILEARQALEAELDGFGDLSETKCVQEEVLPDWVWDGACETWTADADASAKFARLRSVFYLLTGCDLSMKVASQHQKIMLRAVSTSATEQDRSVLLVITIIHAVGSHLNSDHVHFLCNSLGVDDRDIGTYLSSRSDDSSDQCCCALVLGDMCWWMIAKLQDICCLCGGEMPIFPNGLPMRGGPVVLGSGIMHKAKDGYKIVVKGYQEDPHAEAVMHAQSLLESSGAKVTKNFLHGAFKVQYISAHDVFLHHGSIFYCRGVPYTILVKPFDTAMTSNRSDLR